VRAAIILGFLVALATTPALAAPWALTSYNRTAGQDGAPDYWSGQFVDTASLRRQGDNVTVDELLVLAPPQTRIEQTILFFTSRVTYGCRDNSMATANLVAHRVDGSALTPAPATRTILQAGSAGLQTLRIVCAGRFAPVTFADPSAAVAYSEAAQEAIAGGGNPITAAQYVRLMPDLPNDYVGIGGAFRGRVISVWMLHVLQPGEEGAAGASANIQLVTFDCQGGTVAYYRWVRLMNGGQIQDAPMVGGARAMRESGPERPAAALLCNPAGSTLQAIQGAAGAVAEARGANLGATTPTPPATAPQPAAPPAAQP
jgi:hypothetical protein